MQELHIENPFVADLVSTWIDMRRRRMEFERIATTKVQEIKAEMTKFQQEHEKRNPKRNSSSSQSSEDEEESQDEDKKQYELDDKNVSKSDVQNIIQQSMLT